MSSTEAPSLVGVNGQGFTRYHVVHQCSPDVWSTLGRPSAGSTCCTDAPDLVGVARGLYGDLCGSLILWGWLGSLGRTLPIPDAVFLGSSPSWNHWEDLHQVPCGAWTLPGWLRLLWIYNLSCNYWTFWIEKLPNSSLKSFHYEVKQYTW